MIGAVNHDGFNLLPYRSRKRRELRRRRLIVLAAAGLAGCAGVGAVGGWDAFERSRLDARRAALDASLRTSGAQAEEHARLTRAEAERRRVRQTAQPLAAPRDRFLALLETLAQTPAQRGVSLQRVSQRTDEVELAAFAPDSQSAARWIKGLERVRDVKSVEIVEMKRHVDRYEFSALVRYTSQRQKGDAK
ncbi:PilN domain-containing protein [Caballeronia sp. BR00000012568055]|uniref:PilN domain-containing protein n=1 Tax=Caballeronia sp. BR00000012568055 TaxID=2918761 RepID=UPI0023F72CA9|nr:PilN domain-containing protein [Caballeronia sp. BR00000012568055]